MHFFRRFEYQQRGTTHVHFLIWVENAPQLGKTETEKNLDYIQINITCRKPDELSEPVLNKCISEYQMHRVPHSATCKRGYRE